MTTSVPAIATKPIIAKIDSIVKIATFKNFCWSNSGLGEFARYNLIYGWNHSGKTTIARILHAIESGQIHEGHSGGSFSASWSNGATISSTKLSGPCNDILVFNRDFTDRNFRSNSDHTGAQSIAVIGEKNQKLKDRLIVHESRQSKITQLMSGLQTESLALQAAIDTAGTNYARVAESTFGGRQFKRTEILGIVKRITSNHKGHLLSEQKKNEKIAEWRLADEFKSVSPVAVDGSDIVRKIPLWIRIANKSAKIQALADLKSNPTLERWVRDGLPQHKGKIDCQYCGNVISTLRISDLLGHFSETYERLASEVNEVVNSLQKANLSIRAPGSTELLNDLRAVFETGQSKLASLVELMMVEIAKWTRMAVEKSQAIEIPIKVKFDYALVRNIRACLVEINSVVNIHNLLVANSSEIKSSAKNAVVNCIAAELIDSIDYISKSHKIDKIKINSDKLSRIRDAVMARANKTKIEIKQASIAASKINEHLKLLLPGDNIEAVSVSDTDFQFQRGGVIAKGMSEGERTAVSLAYYFVKIEENGRSISDVILVIDDPISSLDANHIFAVYGVIVSKLAQSRQLFILTHNSEFFSLMKEWIKGKDVKKEDRCLLFINKTSSASIYTSSIIPIPKILERFKSDYHYLYFSLKVLNDEQSPSLESLCGVPNMLRRFLEMYLGFQRPHITAWKDKIDIIVDDTAKQIELYKFTNELSHAHSLERAMLVPDYIMHCKGMIRLVIEGVSKNDPAHIGSMNQAIAK